MIAHQCVIKLEKQIHKYSREKSCLLHWSNRPITPC